MIWIAASKGDRPDDFAFGVDGELVVPPSPCDNADQCGCDRCFGGIASRKGTTVAVVVDIDLTLRDIARRELAAYFRGRRLALWEIEAYTEELEPFARELATYPLGTRVRVGPEGLRPAWLRPGVMIETSAAARYPQ